METLTFLISILFAGFMFYRIINNHQKNVSIQLANSINSKDELLIKELERREKIISKLEMFLKESSFIKVIGTWKQEPVYQYVVNKEDIFEFDDFLTDKNQKIGVDEKELCFRQIRYIKTANSESFLNYLEDEIKTLKSLESAL